VDLQIPHLGLVDDLADVVHQSLDGPDPPRGGASVSISMGLGSESSRSSRSGGTSEVQDPVTVWSSGPEVASGSWNSVSPWAG
jgi:hypothetical protein